MIIAQQILTEYHPALSLEDKGWSTSDVIASIAAALSLFSLSFTCYAVYLNKELEIKYKKFESLGIDTIHVLIEPLDEIFHKNSGAQIAFYLQAVTSTLVDIELFLIQFGDLYTKLEIDKISALKDEFSDFLYLNPGTEINQLKVKYLIFKTKLLYELYDFALMDDIGFWKRIIRFKKRILSW